MADPGRGEGAGAPSPSEPIVKTHRFGEAGRIEEASSRLVRAKVEGEAPSIVLGPEGLPLNWNEWNTDTRRAWMEVQRDRAAEQLLDYQLRQREDPHAISPAQKEAIGKVYELLGEDIEAGAEAYVRAIDTLSQRRAEPIVHGDVEFFERKILELTKDLPQASRQRFSRRLREALKLTPPEAARKRARVIKDIGREPDHLKKVAAKRTAREAAPATALPPDLAALIDQAQAKVNEFQRRLNIVHGGGRLGPEESYDASAHATAEAELASYVNAARGGPTPGEPTPAAGAGAGGEGEGEPAAAAGAGGGGVPPGRPTAEGAPEEPELEVLPSPLETTTPGGGDGGGPDATAEHEPISPIEARNKAIEALAARTPDGGPGFILTGDLAELRDEILNVHNASKARQRERGEPETGISSEEFIILHKKYQERINAGTSSPYSERVEFSDRLKHIHDLNQVAYGGRDEQDVFSNYYDFYKQKLDAANAANVRHPGTVPQDVIDSSEERLKSYVMEFAGEINPSAENIRDGTLKRVIQSNYEDALERLVFRIVGKSLLSETGDYDLGFYGNINIDAITNLLLTLSQNDKLEPVEDNRRLRRAQLGDVSNLREGVHRVHEINKLITTNQLDGAKQAAPSLLPEYLQRLEKTKMVGIMMRFMESGHLELLSKDGYIKTENYKEMMGTSLIQKTGKPAVDQSASLAQQLHEFVGLLKSIPGIRVNDLEVLNQAKPWEVDLAFSLARDLYNVQHRSAELASMGRIPKGLEAFAATVFGGFRNIFNPANYVLERFKPGEKRGGYRWFERLMDAMQRGKKLEGYGKAMLEKIKGDTVRFFELPTMAGIRGYISSWKANEGWLKQTESIYEPRGLVSRYDVYSQGEKIYDHITGPTTGTGRIGIGHLLDTGAITFRNESGQDIKWNDRHLSKEALDEMHADFFRSIFFKPRTGVRIGGRDVDPELRDELQVALGTIYKVSLTPSGGRGVKEDRELNLVKEQIRTLIWQRVARDNPLAILPYLHGLKYSDDLGKDRVDQAYASDPRLEQVGEEWKGRTVLEDIYDTPGWLAFHRKLTLLNEIKLAKNRGFQDEHGDPNNPRNVQGDLSYSLLDAIRDTEIATGLQRDANGEIIPGTGDIRINLTAAEIKLYKLILKEGLIASADLANIKYAFIPFASDLINENSNFLLPGPNSYERHFGDIANISSSTNALNELMENLGLVKKYEDMVEFIMKFTKGIVAVHGDEYAKDKARPVIEATFGFFRRGDNVIDKEEEYIDEDKLPMRKRIARWIKQQDETHVIAGQFHKPQSEAQMFYNSLEVLALDRKQTHNAMEKLKAAGLMGKEEEDHIRKRFGGFLGFLFRMFMEDILRLGKLGAAGTAWSLFGKSFDPKGAVE